MASDERDARDLRTEGMSTQVTRLRESVRRESDAERTAWTSPPCQSSETATTPATLLARMAAWHHTAAALILLYHVNWGILPIRPRSETDPGGSTWARTTRSSLVPGLWGSGCAATLWPRQSGMRIQIQSFPAPHACLECTLTRWGEKPRGGSWEHGLLNCTEPEKGSGKPGGHGHHVRALRPGAPDLTSERGSKIMRMAVPGSASFPVALLNYKGKKSTVVSPFAMRPRRDRERHEDGEASSTKDLSGDGEEGTLYSWEVCAALIGKLQRGMLESAVKSYRLLNVPRLPSALSEDIVGSAVRGYLVAETSITASFRLGDLTGSAWVVLLRMHGGFHAGARPGKDGVKPLVMYPREEDSMEESPRGDLGMVPSGSSGEYDFGASSMPLASLNCVIGPYSTQRWPLLVL
ncbi:hypothetical protein OE88DRAFT_1648079 [Heliocybe sulcata]|uniref:Uncharacterized protein n=1 Tax=Heliocybe sulcata TaxID=5364 RepID=A0A5C3MQY8_9AGAM|nr:hypothetical protein OE88DRAFT_1648079 [Heliocybe sulcata]